MKFIFFLSLFTIFSGCGRSASDSGGRGILDDSSSVTTFPVSLGKNGEKIAVLATKDKNSQIFRSFVKHEGELSAISENRIDEYPGLRVFNYKGPEARYSLIIPNLLDNYSWYLVCPYRVRLVAGTECILFGKINNYVFQTYINDVTKFGLVVSSIKAQKPNYIK